MKTFEELGVSEEIRKAIDELGFEQPMPVQEEVIPYLLGNRNDVIALAQTGTGKTAAFGIPLLQRINIESKETQAVVLSPTRELCLQIADDLKDFGKYLPHLHIAAVYGGASIETQIKQLRRGVQIIVATPGRLIDLMHRGKAKLENVHNVVLDEADEMLNMGFQESITEILTDVPEDRNTLLFSATMSREVERVAKGYLHDYKEIVVGSRNEGAENVNHIYYMVNAKDKYLALKRLVDFYPKIYGIVFCRTKVETQEVADKLIKDGYNAESLHGDLSQQQRDLTTMDSILKTDVDEEQIAPYVADIKRQFEYIDKEDIIKKIVTVTFGRFLDYYKNAPEIEKPSTSRSKGGDGRGSRGEGKGYRERSRGPRQAEAGFTRLFINLGKTDGFYPGEVMQFINKHVQGRQEVGHIDLLQKQSYVEVPEKDAKKVMNALDGLTYKGRKVRCNDANEGGSGSRGHRRGSDERRNGRERNRRQRDFDEDFMPQRKYRKDDWKELMRGQSGQLKGEEPDFSEEGWARRRPKKK